MGWLKQQILFLIVMEAEKSKTRHSLTGFLVRTLFLLCTWLPPLLYPHTAERDVLLLSLLHKGTNLIPEHSTLIA